jgi:hypothetical protein
LICFLSEFFSNCRHAFDLLQNWLKFDVESSFGDFTSCNLTALVECLQLLPEFVSLSFLVFLSSVPVILLSARRDPSTFQGLDINLYQKNLNRLSSQINAKS